MTPAYRPFALTISRAASILLDGNPRLFSAFEATVSFGNFARRYRSKNSFRIRGLSTKMVPDTI
jgi:hypothetical protein